MLACLLICVGHVAPAVLHELTQLTESQWLVGWLFSALCVCLLLYSFARGVHVARALAMGENPVQHTSVLLSALVCQSVFHDSLLCAARVHTVVDGLR